MLGRFQESKTWLLWTWLLLLGLVAMVTLASDLETSQALTALEDIEVSKAVNMPSAVPGQAPAPLYTVTFTNPNGTDVVLDVITDTLPPGFEFIDMHPTGGWLEPPDDDVEPEIVWRGPITIAATAALSLVYSVDTIHAAPSTTAYVNRVEAVTTDGAPIGPASAPLLIGQANLSVDKEAWPTRVLNGGLVTYTVVFANSGHLTGTLEVITDTLDPSLTFAGMATGSDVTTPPQGISETLVWTGTFDVPALGALTLCYRVQTAAGSGWSFPDNRVEARAGDKTVGPAWTQITVGPGKAYVFLPTIIRNFTYAYFAVSKSAFPTTVTTSAGEVVTYTLTIKNEGDTTGTLLTVDDTLPSGFTYQGMASGSDVQADPDGTTGTITWSLTPAIDMLPGSQKQLIYLVSPSQAEGQYTNYANVTAQAATVPAEPASATITVERGILLEDHFEEGIDRWTPFLNLPGRLAEGQWYWSATDGYGSSGGLTQDAYRVEGKEAEDGLMMYLGEEAEDWTDYRMESKMILRTDHYPQGVWFRGQYQDVGEEDRGGWVTGYYVMVGGKKDGKTHYVSLKQLQTLTDCWGAACDNPHNLYDFNNPHELTVTKKDGDLERWRWYTLVVEARGANIKVWLDDVLYIDYTDPKEPFLTGTVGFKTFKADTVSYDDVIVTPLH